MRFLFTFSLCFIIIIQSTAQVNEKESIINAMHSISSHDIMAYVETICDDKYEGRLTGTGEYIECAEWLASFLNKSGLEPAGDDGTWFQEFTLPYTLVYPDCGVSLELPAGHKSIINKHYDYITEFMPGSTSGNGTVNAEVIYAGYGISAPELGYDDYDGIDVEGKIILIEREAPVSPSAGPEKFNPWREYSFHQYKLKNAVEHGAAGMIYNYGPIANPNNAYNKDFIYVHIGDSAVKDVFSGTGKDHREVVQIIKKKLKPNSFNTGKRATIKMSTGHFENGRGVNVIGLRKGDDPKLAEETIIIGAHLDHLGKCYEIIPGANDNASAVAVMMAVAKAINDYDISLKRSVLFLGFGAEEQALAGSRKYVEDPVNNIKKSVLLNMDGVGTGHSINATAGKNFPVLLKYFEDNAERYIHRPLRSNSFSNLGRPRLDASIFLSAGVPSLSFSTYGSRSYYHIPWDSIDMLNPEIMEDMARLLLLSLIDMANSDDDILQK